MIQKYIRENYASIVEVAKVITKGRLPDYEDLAHEVMCLLLEGNRTKMNKLVESDVIKWYIIRTTINQYRSSSSRYYKKYNKQNKLVQKNKNLVVEHLSHITKLDLTNEKINQEEILEFIDQKLQEVAWFERNCFLVYYWDELTLDSMSELTGISRNTLYSAIKETRIFLQNEIKKQGFRR